MPRIWVSTSPVLLMELVNDLFWEKLIPIALKCSFIFARVSWSFCIFMQNTFTCPYWSALPHALRLFHWGLWTTCYNPFPERTGQSRLGGLAREPYSCKQLALFTNSGITYLPCFKALHSANSSLTLPLSPSRPLPSSVLSHSIQCSSPYGHSLGCIWNSGIPLRWTGESPRFLFAVASKKEPSLVQCLWRQFYIQLR